jgi:hypothetical protein
MTIVLDLEMLRINHLFEEENYQYLKNEGNFNHQTPSHRSVASMTKGTKKDN